MTGAFNDPSGPGEGTRSEQDSRSLSDREGRAPLEAPATYHARRAQLAEQRIVHLRAENDRLREAIALHARTLDDRALGHPEHNQRDRDSIDNDLYNLTRRLDPAWWDKRVPGMAGSPLSSDEQGQST